MDSAFEVDPESDTSSIDGTKDAVSNNERLLRRIDSLQQENRVLKTEAEALKLKIKGLNEINQQLRQNSVNIQAKAEQEEEFISNTLLKKITELKKEKESLAINYEQEEECLTNELNRKFTQLRQEKVALEQTLAREQEDQVSKLKSRIEKLENDMSNKQECLDRLRREKIELENALEQEQESLVNRLWKKMEKLETEKRTLQEKLESLGTLLSASSSNQSLASVSHLSVSGNGNQANTTSTSGLNVVSNRPTSSGPGSLRNSLRRHTSAHPQYNTASQFSHSISSPNPSSTSSLTSNRPIASASLSVNSDAVTTGETRVQLNQSASMKSDSFALKNNVGDIFGGSLIPAQSPMDVDHFDLAVIGSISPSRPEPSCAPFGAKMASKISGAYGKTRVSDDPSCILSQSAPVPQLPSDWDSHMTSSYVNRLREEVRHLRQLLEKHEAERATKMPFYESEERSAIEENRRLRKLLQVEKERREVLSRQLSESESSLEMEDERQFNEARRNPRVRTTSDSASPFHPPGQMIWSGTTNPSLIYGPGHAYAAAVAAGFSGPSTLNRICRECGQRLPTYQDDWSTPTTGTSSAGRILPNSLNTGFALSSASRLCQAPCCSPAKPCGTHHVSLPTSPATPTTSSGGGIAQAFAKPFNRNSMTCGSADRVHVGGETSASESSIDKVLSPYSSSEQLFVNMRDNGHMSEQDDEDEDDDPRCATPPVCQSESIVTN